MGYIDKTFVSFSEFNEYQAFSDGYYWMEYESTVAVTDVTNKNSLEDALNSPVLWNKIGLSLFNMPYIMIDGEYQFIFPVLSDSSADDVLRQSTLGDIVKTLTKSHDIEINFSNKTKFVLYNTKIAVEEIEDRNDANIVNIAYNVITLFLLQKLRRGR